MGMNLNAKQVAVLNALNEKFGDVVSLRDLSEHFSDKSNGKWPTWYANKEWRVGRGLYTTRVEGPTDAERAKAAAMEAANGGAKVASNSPFPKFKGAKMPAFKVKPTAAPISSVVDSAQSAQVIEMPAHGPVAPRSKPLIQIGAGATESLIPEKDPCFVPFGMYDTVHNVIKTGMFFPVFITGLSGNGKTLSVEQACANLKREMIRVQITPETDEDDLIGGFRLINGETVWFDGPAVIAMERGAILLVDEVDYGTGKISCLQSILEGKGIFIKKVNRFVHQQPGFNVIATANTKGRGSEEHGGRFVNTNIMNEALLERFAITLEQEFPNAKLELRILSKLLGSLERLSPESEKFADYLTQWADTVRRTFEQGGIEDVITTRRLTHIIRTFAILGDGRRAVEHCVTRFDDETKQSFLTLFDKIAVDPNANANAQAAAPASDAETFTP